jgi:RimJ/RimL family protein N-acetyltransferase
MPTRAHAYVPILAAPHATNAPPLRSAICRFGVAPAPSARHAAPVEPYPSPIPSIETERLIIRPAVESDRARFVELFTDQAFTVFSAGVHDHESANARFDLMLDLTDAIAYAKQPVIERGSGSIVGYTGADSVTIDGVERLEWGWRFVPDARGRGYATEATAALLAVADRHDDGEMLCIVAADNHASRRVADKVGFRWWRRIDWMGDPNHPTDLLVRPIGSGGPPLLAPDPA